MEGIMEKTRRTITGLRRNYCLEILILSMFIFLAGTLFNPGISYADDAENCLDGALFVTDTLYIPKLAVEGTEQLYSACLQIKQGENELFLELTSFKLLNCQETSDLTATLSTAGKLHIPYLDIQGASFWTIDLQLIESASLLPIRFQIANFKKFVDDNLGMWGGGIWGQKIDYWKCTDPDYAKHYCPNK